MKLFDYHSALRLSGYQGKFKDSLKTTLKWLAKDNRVDNIKVAAYILATMKAESGYSLQRWEADYLCEGIGIPYKNKPCNRALNYYRSSSSTKTNYYNLGTDQRGLPYFGRGAIQLTGIANYKKYGKKIGVNLEKHGDLALEPKNSYKILVSYINDRTKRYILSGNLTSARRSVNGGVNGLHDVNAAYHRWVNILTAAQKVEKMKSKRTKIIVSLVIIAVVITVGIILFKKLKK